jgi:hypothetical protein
MIHPPIMHPPAHRDQYAQKGTLEGHTPSEPQECNCNCHGAGLDEDGMPCDMVAIAEDVEGAEVDETQG